jgi:hypothetical protein
MAAAQLTRDGALLWLNDRSGRMAQLTVMSGPDAAFPASRATAVVSATGRLIHWRGSVPVKAWPEVDRHGDHSGAYRIGPGVLYVPELATGSATTDEDGRVDVLYLPLDTNTDLYVLVADDEHPIFGGDA